MGTVETITGRPPHGGEGFPRARHYAINGLQVGCLDENAVLAFVRGTLDEGQRQVAETHLVACSLCRERVGSAGGSQAAEHGGGDARPATVAVPRLALMDAFGLGDLKDGDAGPSGGAQSTGLARGVTVGRYVILDLVGRGGMGEVYAAYDPQLDRKVALKLLHQQMRQDTGRERLLREAKAIARLSHPNVVVVHDAGAIGDRVYLAMEFLDGDTLDVWLAAVPRGWRAIRDAFAAAGEGLAAAHAAGLVHRDFKPQNVMVGRDGSVRVMDFGVASDRSKRTDAGTRPIDATTDDSGASPRSDLPALTRTGALLGTPRYMAPEQFLGHATDARTDQFSFCVALYEALYGERPFRGDSLVALAEAVVAGRVRELDQKARVPAFLRKLLLRGLSADPAARYPSMRALLEQLRHDPARRRRGVGITAAVALAAIAATAGAQHLASRGQRLCRAAGDRLAGVWELSDGGVRRREIHDAFVATGKTFGDDTWNRVSGLLDDYARRWTAMYTDACEATHVRGDQSAEVLDLRMTCLESPRSSLRALTDVFRRADSAVLIEAVNAAQALPPLDRCSNVPVLRSTFPPPADPATRARVAATRSDLAEVKALADTGRWSEARRKLPRLVEAARSSDYAPLLAETLATRGWLEDQAGEKSYEKTYEEALWTALEGRHDDVALECAAQLVGVGYEGSLEDAARWDHLGQALLKRLGAGHDRMAGWLMNNRAIVGWRRGEYRQALADAEAALALKRKVLPADHPDVAISLGVIGFIREALGDPQGALEAAEGSLQVYRQAYGPNHPHISEALNNRGEALAQLGRHAEAERDLRAAIDLSVIRVGPDHPWTANSLTALGKTLVALQRSPEAIAFLKRALVIRERSEPNARLAAETRFALARALWETNQDRRGARTAAAAARDVFRKSPGPTKPADEIDDWLARHLIADDAAARPRGRR